MKRLIKKASGSVKIKQTLKDKVNSDLMRYNTSGVDSYFEKIPLEPIFEVLEKHNIVAVQEDGTNWEGFLTGRDEKVRFDLVLEENGERKPIENAILSLSWYKFDDRIDEENGEYKKGRYEVITYLG